ncbi:MAG: hypothetical protein WAK53_04310 [Chromatiaceae bacterium]|jgi:hypothetical protein
MNRAFKLAVMGLFCVAALPLFVVDASAAWKISFKLAGKDPNFAEMKPALSRLLKTCPDLLRYQDDMEWIKASSDEATAGYVEQDHGWKQWVSFQVKVKDDPAEIPADWDVKGQELLYAVGADGVDVGKQMAGRFCGEGEKAGLIKTD